MSYPVYYNGEITISPETDPDRATLLDDALRTNHLERLGITAEDGRDLYHGCDWRYRDGCLSIEGESRDGQEAWLRLLDTRFFQPNGFALSGEVRSEEHTSELQSLRHLVCRLLLGKTKSHLLTASLAVFVPSPALAATPGGSE